jgi:hypothetical protein
VEQIVAGLPPQLILRVPASGVESGRPRKDIPADEVDEVVGENVPRGTMIRSLNDLA